MEMTKEHGMQIVSHVGRLGRRISELESLPDKKRPCNEDVKALQRVIRPTAAPLAPAHHDSPTCTSGPTVLTRNLMSSNLLLMNLERIAVLHLQLWGHVSPLSAAMTARKGVGGTYRIRAVGRLDPTAIEQEPHRVGGLALALAEGVHQLLQRGGALNLEKDLIVVVRHFDVEMLGRGRLFRLARRRRSVVRHGAGTCGNPKWRVGMEMEMR